MWKIIVNSPELQAEKKAYLSKMQHASGLLVVFLTWNSVKHSRTQKRHSRPEIVLLMYSTCAGLVNYAPDDRELSRKSFKTVDKPR